MELSLWPACVKAHPFREQLRAAATAGFDSLPIGPLTYRALRQEGRSDRDIRELATEHGVRLGHYDGFSDWAPVRVGASLPEAARAIFDVQAGECLRICEALELPAICATGAFAAGECDMGALADGFAAFCERAQPLGIRVDLEFLPMWGVPDLHTAWEIVRRAASPNGALLFDTWHFFRGRPDLALLRSLPPAAIRTVQLADAPRTPQSADLFEDCLRYRMLPGEGELPLREVLAILRDKGRVENIGPEVFSDALDSLDALECGRRAAGSLAQVLGDAGFARPGPGPQSDTQ